VRSPAKRETTPCLPSLSTESPGGCQSTMKLIEKATMLVHCKRAKDHGDAVAIAAAGDNGWMVLLTVRDRCYLGEESLVARVASHVAARRWRRNSQRRDFFDVLRLLCILTQACPSRQQHLVIPVIAVGTVPKPSVRTPVSTHALEDLSKPPDQDTDQDTWTTVSKSSRKPKTLTFL
jgi:hypothetical protein